MMDWLVGSSAPASAEPSVEKITEEDSTGTNASCSSAFESMETLSSVGSVSYAPSVSYAGSSCASEPEALHVDAWLDAIKPGYGDRFFAAFEQLGVEDAADVANIDQRFYVDLHAALLECGAKPMHIKNIRLALQDMGCPLDEDGGTPSFRQQQQQQQQQPHRGGRKQAAHGGYHHASQPVARATVAAAEAAALAAASRSQSPARRPSPSGHPPHRHHPRRHSHEAGMDEERASNGSFSAASSCEDDELVPVRVVPLSSASRSPFGLGAQKPQPVHHDSAPPLPSEDTASSAAMADGATSSAPAPAKPPLPRSDSGFARKMQFEEYKLAVERAAKEASMAVAAHETSSSGLWQKLAKGIETEAELQAFFARRQPNVKGAGRTLHIQSAVKVVNNACLHGFASAQRADPNALKASKSKADSYLFHGCAQASATNIQADGLRIAYAANGMLGRGLYGAPDPRKSLQYCKNSENGKFMFVCRFNLSGAKRAGPDTPHRNTIFDEFCIFDERHVVVLWMLKLA